MFAALGARVPLPRRSVRRRRAAETATAAARSGSGRPLTGSRPTEMADTDGDGKPVDDLPSETRVSTAIRSDRSETIRLQRSHVQSVYILLICAHTM